MKPLVKSKSTVQIPDGIYVGNISGWSLTILSQDQYGKTISLNAGIKTPNLAVVVVIEKSVAYCFDRGFRFSKK